MLFSENYLALHPIDDLTDSYPWIEIEKGESQYEKFGKVTYQFIPLQYLHEKITKPEPPPPPERAKKPVVREIIIHKPLYFVFEIVLNLDFRLMWNKKIKELRYDEGKINRVGTKHRCLFETGFADFETINNDFGPDKLVYGERIKNVPLAKETSVYYVLSEQNGGTKVRVEIHFIPFPVLGWIMKLFLVTRLSRGTEKLLTELKKLSEEQEMLPYEAAMTKA